MLPWYQWLVFAAVPPLIFLLYFLKLRRAPLQVPSTYLWSKTVEDLHVNSLWQRLRNNLLLWLQFLAVGLLGLSCFNPGCDGTELSGDRFIFIVDRSASMSATDTPEGISRLEEAKNQIYATIDQMKSTDAAMVISFADAANVEQSYTNTKSLLKQKIKAITQSQRSSDLNEALRAASGLANPGRTSDQASGVDIQVADALSATMLIFSDGAVKKIEDFRLGNLNAEYHPIGSLLEPPKNIGITSFSINDQLEDDGKVQIFARLQNSGLEEQDVSVSLLVDGELADARQVTVEGVQSTSLNFDLTNSAAGLANSIPIELRVDDEDVYMQDNRATCVLNPPRMVNALVVTDDRTFFELAMTTDRLRKFAMVEFQDREFLSSKKYLDDVILGSYDLVIYDQCVPKTMPRCSTVFFGAIPPQNWSVEQTVATAPIVDVDQTHPVMFDVQMSRVNVLESTVLKGPQGSSALVQSTSGPIMVIGPRGSFEDLVVGFPLTKLTEEGDSVVNTDWPRVLSFPFFIQNTLLTLGGASQFGRAKDYQPGALVQIKPRLPYQQITVTSPGEKKKLLAMANDNRFLYSDTENIGVYSVAGKDADEADHLFTVNLMDRQESDLAVRENLGLGLEEIQATASTQVARKEWWVWIVFTCLVVITIEWLIYNKRVFI
jgi:hypothetical protein